MSSSRGTLHDHLLRGRVDLHGARHRRHRREQLPRDLADGAIGGQRGRAARALWVCSTNASWVRRSRVATIAPEPSGAASGSALPSTRGQSQGGVLQLEAPGSERHRQLAEHLRVGVQGVAALAPFSVVDGGPAGRHRSSGYPSAQPVSRRPRGAPTTVSAVIDLHCHVLPGIDDGPQTIEESLAMARVAARGGTRVLVATPHVNRRYDNRASRIAPLVDDLNRRIGQEGLELEVRPGAEVALLSVAGLDAEELLRFGSATGRGCSSSPRRFRSRTTCRGSSRRSWSGDMVCCSPTRSAVRRSSATRGRSQRWWAKGRSPR